MLTGAFRCACAVGVFWNFSNGIIQPIFRPAVRYILSKFAFQIAAGNSSILSSIHPSPVHLGVCKPKSFPYYQASSSLGKRPDILQRKLISAP